MISNYTKLISIILYRFRFEIDEEAMILPQGALACVMWKSEEDHEAIPIIFLSLELASWNPKDLAFLIIHEILHTLDRHHSRKGAKDPLIWNLACDHVINTRISNDITNGNSVVTVPQSAFFADKPYEGLAVEEVYAKLMENRPETKQSGDGDGEPCDGSPGDRSQGKTQVKSDGDWKDVNEDLVESQGQASESQCVAETNDMKETIKVAMDSEPFKSISKSRGNTSGGLTEYLKSIIDVTIPWDLLLEKAIKSSVRTPSENRSWRTINKRMRSHQIMQPARNMDECQKSNLYIFADHSASVSKGDLRKMASLIVQSIGFFEKITIIKHDTKIVDEIEVTIASNSDDIREAIAGKGRGGTCHKCVFQDLQTRLDDEEDEEDIGLVLILTDYESNIESIWNNYKWTQEIPVKLILTQSIHVASYVDDTPIILVADSD